jgi:phosphoribosylanthranilate isomerase
MWIKICGNTNLEDARVAAEAGADALGFVFAPSPRRVSIGQARRIIGELPPGIEKVGVFVDADLSQIAATVDHAGLTGVQLHRFADPGLPSQLRENYARTARPVKILRVLKLEAAEGRENPQAVSTESEAQGSGYAAFDRSLDELARDSGVYAVLVDSAISTTPGGTGTSFDWRAAQASFQRATPGTRLIVAGGLRPENVGLAIATLRPWGVDAVSGIEATPGKKDPARLRAFIAAVRDFELVNTDKSAPAPARNQQSGQSAQDSATVAGEAKDLAGAG